MDNNSLIELYVWRAVSPVNQDTVAAGNGFMERRVSWLGGEGDRGVKVMIGVKP